MKLGPGNRNVGDELNQRGLACKRATQLPSPKREVINPALHPYMDEVSGLTETRTKSLSYRTQHEQPRAVSQASNKSKTVVCR